MLTVLILTHSFFYKHGNQSFLNFVRGLLEGGYKVKIITTSTPGERHYLSIPQALEILECSPGALEVEVVGRNVKSFLKGLEYSFKRLKKLILIKRNVEHHKSKNFSEPSHTLSKPKKKKVYSNSVPNEWYYFPVFLIFSEIMARKLFSEVKNKEYDVIVFHDTFGGFLSKYLSLFHPLLWRKVCERSIGYYHGTLLVQTVNSVLSSLIYLPLSFIGTSRLKFKKVIMTNDGTRGDLVLRKLGYKGRVLFIMNGIDRRLEAEEYVRSDFPTKSRVLICSSSRLVDWKRIDRNLLVVKKLKEYGLSLKYFIIGDGPAKRQLENLVSQFGLNDEVRFLGNLTYDEVKSVFKTCHFSLSAFDIGNLGNQIFESIWFDVIPIVLDDSSTDDLLIDGYNSLKFTLEDVDKFCQRFVQLLDNREELLKMYENVRKTKERLLTWKERNLREIAFIRE